MKKLLSLLLVFMLLFNISAPVFAALSVTSERTLNLGFEDMVPSHDWSYPALSNAVNAGLMKGSSGKIRPYDSMTRAEMIAIVTNALGLDRLDDNAQTPYMADLSAFTDVKANDWFYDQISMGYNLKLISGVSHTEMVPSRLVTREQAFIVISHLMSLDYKTVDTTILNQFKDGKSISAWAKPHVASVVKAGYVSGFDGYIKPNDAITRQEFAQLLYNLFSNNFIRDQKSADALVNQTVNSNVIISAAGLTIKNLNVAGDIIIGDGVGNGDVTLDQVTITGRLIVRGGGENSIILKNTSAKSIIVNKLSDGSVRVYGDDGSEIPYVEVLDGKDAVIIDCDVDQLIVSQDGLDIVIQQTIKTFTLSGDQTRISGKGKIDKLVLEKGVIEVLLGIENVNITNQSGSDVKIVDKDGKSTIIVSDKTINTTLVADSELQSEVADYKFVVSFHTNGGSTLAENRYSVGAPLGELPVPIKENAIFEGWFTDEGSFENAVANDTRVYSDMNLYAKYIESAPMVQNDMKSIMSVMDVSPNYAITILSTDPSMSADAVKAAITFETITDEPSEFLGISVTGSDGTYVLTALGGYTSGGSYSLTLNHDALSFQGEISSVRRFNLTIAMPEPVLNLQLNDALTFVPVVEVSNVTQNGVPVDSIFAPLYTMDESASEIELYGTFTYSGSEVLSVGTQIAIYAGTKPTDRVIGIDYTEQPISYVNITDVSGSTISYGNSDPSEIIFTPDVLPVDVADDQDGDPNNNAITIDISKMTYSGADYEEMGLTPSTTVDLGDYISFYTGDLGTTNSITYAAITEVSVVGGFYVIRYVSTNEAEVFGSMDMASSSDISLQEITSSIGINEMELAIAEQVEKSGFAGSASEFLTALAQTDEATRKEVTEALGIENFDVQSAPAVAVLGDSKPKVTVKVKISDDLEHFSGNGVNCKVTITTEVELGDNMTLTISGTFVEEFKMKMNIKSKTIWKKKWIFPYISDYKVTASIDVYNYTYLALNMNLKSNSTGGWSDELNITDSIDRLQEVTSKIDANNEVREFFELYKAMMEEDHDYFQLFDQNIAKFKGSIDPLCILAYSVSVDFVVSLDANAALGSEFSYEKVTRYTFTVKVKDKSTTSDQTDLKDEKYTVNVYAMGVVGIRAGIQLTIAIGFVDTKSNSVGISAEVGAYFKIWGFVFYNLTSTNDKITTKSNGACYMEVGIYFETAFKAQVGDGKVSYEKTLYSKTWPLWSAGSKYYIFDFKYILNDDNDDIIIKGATSYTLPEATFRMLEMNFKNGDVSKEYKEATDFNFTVKDDPKKVFKVSKEGKITITPPKDSDIATATLEITWKKSPLSFTSVPISRTFQLTWDNLADSYVINFDTNGGSNQSSIIGAYNSAIALPTPTKEGYVFAGWYTDEALTNAFTLTKMPATNSLLYAQWVADEANYTIYHYQETLEGDYILVSTDTLLGTTDTTVTPAVRAFTGFNAPVTQTVTVKGDGDTFVEYYYERNEYDVTYVLNNGSANIVSTFKYGSKIFEPKLYRAGYVFTGWQPFVEEMMPASNLSYTAQWSLENYTITYDLDGGTVSGNPENYTIQSSTFTLNTPTKANYVFAGWTGTGLSAESKLVTVESGSIGHRYYTATWKAENDTLYSVYHYREDANGNYTILELEALKGTAGNLTAAVAKVYPNYTAGAIVQEVISSNETTVVEIRYDRNGFILTFDANGGVGGTVETVKYDSVIVAPTVTRTGYVFTGWDQPVLATMPTENITYVAQWTPIMYNITFDKNAVDATGSMDTLVMAYDTAQTLTANVFALTGYTFVGWTTTSNGTGTVYTDQQSVSNLTAVNGDTVVLYAKWFNPNGVNAFDVKYSAQYQVFDMSSVIGGRAYDASWGTAGSSSGHQFDNTMLSGRYFVIRVTGSPTVGKSIAIYMYEADGTPVVQGTSANLYALSAIGLTTNINLDNATRTSLESLYGPNWAQGLAAVGTINSLWDEGFKFTSSNGFGYFFSGKIGSTIPVGIILNNLRSNPTVQQLLDITDFVQGPLVP